MFTELSDVDRETLARIVLARLRSQTLSTSDVIEILLDVEAADVVAATVARNYGMKKQRFKVLLRCARQVYSELKKREGET